MITLVVGAICGLIAMAIASAKGRSMVGWFFGGFFLGLIGIIIVACLSNLKEEKARQHLAELEQHRLREQLRQERLKSEAFRRYSMERLDVHDNALGMDTRSRQALPGSTAQGQASISFAPDGRSGPVPPVDPAEATWHYEQNGRAVGPISETSLKLLLRANRLGPTTLIWTEGFSEWIPANQVPAFRSESFT